MFAQQYTATLNAGGGVRGDLVSLGDLPRRLRAGLSAAATALRSLHADDYLDAKARDLGWFSVMAAFVTVFFVATTWAWDYTIDPVNASRTLLLRGLETLAILAMAIAMWRGVRTTTARIALLAGPLIVELLFIEVLARLEQGPLYGLGGFLYFFLFVPLLCASQSLRFSVLVLTAITLLPTLLSPFGVTSHLNMPLYHVYVWMPFGPMVAILVLFECLYLTVHRYRRELERWAITDALTGAPNRHHFLAVSRRLLKAARRSGEPAAVLFVDVDHFKQFNDLEGHAAGDRVLQELAMAITSALRESDVVGRYGGEEFVVYLHEADGAVARESAERIRRAVRGCSASHLPITVSVGIASVEGGDVDAADIESLIEQADRGLYAAKRGGRDRVVFGEHSAAVDVGE